VLQFAFGSDAADAFLPHNMTRDCVVYTGTHDNDTILGWYQETSTAAERTYALQYLGTDASDITWDLIRLAWASVAHTAITPVQDLLRLGHGSRMNTPSTTGAPNWFWRLVPGALTAEVAGRLKELTTIYGRTARRA
jgi:4-alpha-glucanotransferase